MTETPIALGANLNRLRLDARLTQAQLARRAGISRPAYRNLESGKSVPRADTLASLAAALDTPIGDLFRSVRRLTAVRFCSDARLRSRQRILSLCARWLDDYVQLEQALDEHRDSALPRLRLALASGTAAPAREVAEIVRPLLVSDQGPIRDICGLLESHGVKVYPMQVASPGFFGLSISEADGGPSVAVNTWERIPVERWIFTAAHELGHLLLHARAYDVTETHEPVEKERQANEFASYFLMPDDLFESEWAEGYGLPLWDRVLKVKRIFRVSYRTVLHRLSAADRAGPSIWRHFQQESLRVRARALLREDEPAAFERDALRASFPEPNRAGEPARLSPVDFSHERLPTLVRKAIEAGHISMSRGAEILEIPIETMRATAASWVQ